MGEAKAINLTKPIGLISVTYFTQTVTWILIWKIGHNLDW
jgi:hypothetical protein